MADPDFEFTAGDVPIPLILTLSNEDGSLIDFTGATNIVFSMRSRGTDVLKIDQATATVFGLPTAGQLSYSWTSGDGDTPGDYDASAEWDAGGYHFSAPTNPQLWIRVLPPVAEALRFRGIFRWIRSLLRKTFAQLPDSDLEMYVESAVNRLVLLYPALVDYDTLSGTDLSFFDEGVGHIVAVRLRPSMPKSVPTGEVVRIHTLNTHFQYSEPAKQGSVPVETLWVNASKVALSRVTAIRNQIAARASAFSPFTISGPTRTAVDSGQRQSLMSSILRLLSEDSVVESVEDAFR